MPYSNLALDADRKNGPAARSFAADAYDRIMVRIKPSYRIQVCSAKMRAHGELPSDPLQTGTHRSPKLAMQKAPSQFIVAARAQNVKALRNTSPAKRQAAKLCYRFGPLTPSARSANLIAGDGTKNGFPAPNKEPPTNQKHDLTGKAPYRFESVPLQQTVRLSRDFSFLYRKAGSCRGCAGLARLHGGQRRAGLVNITTTAGNISVRPYSGTAVPARRFASVVALVRQARSG